MRSRRWLIGIGLGLVVVVIAFLALPRDELAGATALHPAASNGQWAENEPLEVGWIRRPMKAGSEVIVYNFQAPALPVYQRFWHTIRYRIGH